MAAWIYGCCLGLLGTAAGAAPALFVLLTWAGVCVVLDVIFAFLGVIVGVVLAVICAVFVVVWLWVGCGLGVL